MLSNWKRCQNIYPQTAGHFILLGCILFIRTGWRILLTYRLKLRIDQTLAPGQQFQFAVFSHWIFYLLALTHAFGGLLHESMQQMNNLTPSLFNRGLDFALIYEGQCGTVLNHL